MAITNDQRKQNYQALRSIGFTKEEANRLKGGSPDKINEMVRQRESILQSVRQEIEVKRQKSGGLKYQSREEVQARRRENYKQLKAAGYSANEANKLKGAQPVKLQYLVDKKRGKSEATIKQNIKKRLVEAGVKPDVARQITSMPVDRLQRITVSHTPQRITPKQYDHKPRGIQYKPVSEADKRYLSNYTYKISYIVKGEDGSKEEKWITITSPDRMTKKAVKKEARDILKEDGAVAEHYSEDGAILISTIEIEDAYYNDMI